MGQWTDTNSITWNYTLSGSDATIGTGSNSTDGNATTSGTGISGAITIPDTVGGYTVKAIGIWSFRGCSNITSVIIPDTVLSIDESGFSLCSKLVSVTFGNSITSIGTMAFYGCAKVASITLPNTLTTLGGGGFQTCNGLTTVTIPASVTTIGDQVFFYCTGLTSVIIEPYSGLHTLGSACFQGSNLLASINLPNSVTTIGLNCFTTTSADLVVGMNTNTIDGTTYTSPTTTDISFFGNPSVTLVAPPPLPATFVSGKVPNWLQPKSGQYTATMGGYESQFPAWCSPTSAANQLGHLVDHGGVTQPTHINDGTDAGNDSPFALAASTIAWDSGYGWGDYLLDGPTYRGQITISGFVTDFGWYMNTNNLGPLGASAGSAVGSTLQNIYTGMVDFYQQVGYTNMVGMVYHFNGSIQNFGVDPAYWTANGHNAGAGVSADYTITLNTIKHEIDNNRTVMACFNGWSITPAGHADLTGMTSGEDETGTYQTLGEYQQAGPHGEQFNIASTDGGNVESYNAGLGHTVLIVGYIPAGSAPDPTGSTEWLVVRDNYTTTHKNVIIPFVDLSKLLATVYVNHTTATYNAITIGGADYTDPVFPIIHYTFDTDGTNSGSLGSSSNITLGTTTIDTTNNLIGTGSVSSPEYTHSGAGVPQIDYNTGTTGTTISFWAKFTGTGGGNRFIYTSQPSPGGTSYQVMDSLWLTSSTSMIYYGQSGRGSQTITSPNSLHDNNWHHFVITCSGGASRTVSVYLDNSILSSTLSTTGLADNTDQRLWLGGCYYGNPPAGSDKGMYGYIDDFRIYDSVLDTTDISDIYNNNNVIDSTATFNNNILTIENSISQNDTDVVSFVLPVGDEIHQLVVTNFVGTGTITYTITTGTTTVKTGTFTSTGTNLLLDTPLSPGGSTYKISLTADAVITYTIVGTKTADLGRVIVASTTYLKASDREAYDMFGETVSIDSNYAILGSRGKDFNSLTDPTSTLYNGGVAYVFERNESTGVWSETAYLKASNPGMGDQFGNAVSISGNYAIVGAWFEDSNSITDQTDNSAENAGAVYVFERNETTGIWSQAAYLKASNPAANENFGAALSISGNYAIVGTRYEEGSNAGAAYVFERNETTGIWSQTAYLKASNIDVDDMFGESVSIDGNYAIVGARGEDSNSLTDQTDNNASQSGAAYVFERNETTGIWSQTAYLKASNIDVDDMFGISVSISGNYAIVGADNEGSNSLTDQTDNNASQSGAAYVFERNETTGIWSQTAYLKASNIDVDDRFGISVSISGNYAIVGAANEDSNSITGQTDNNASRSGAAYVFERNETTGAWEQIKYLKASSMDVDDQFGYSVSISGVKCIVSAIWEASSSITDQTDNNASRSGAAYIFDPFVDISLDTRLVFTNNMLTIDNVTSTTDTDLLDFVLPAGYNIPELNVTNFEGTGNVSYTITTGGNTIVSGTFNADSTNLLNPGIPLFSISADTTYGLTITADALIGYSIVGTRGVTNLANYSIITLLLGGYTEQQMIDAGKWNADSNANHFNSTYSDAFLDISGNVKVTDNILMETGDIDLHSYTYTDPHVFTADVGINNRLFVVGDVSMGDASLNIVGDISINGVMSVGSYKSDSISVTAAIPDSGYSTSGTTTTFTEYYTNRAKKKYNEDISLNLQVTIDLNEPNIFTSTDAKTTANNLSWQDVQLSSTGKYMIAVVGGNSKTSGASNETGNVWVSTDFGESWTQVTVGGSSQNWISAMVSGDGSLMMVKARGNVLYKSTDYGVNWTQVTITIPGKTYADGNNYGGTSNGRPGITMKMATDGLHLSTLYCNNPEGTGQQATNSYYTFITSSDAGATWTETASTYGKISQFNTSRDGKYIALLYYDNSTKPKYSDDYGATFYTLSNAPNSSYGASLYQNAVCISNVGTVCIEIWEHYPTFHNLDVTTGTVSGGSNNAVNTQVIGSVDHTGGENSGMNCSGDGKYILYFGYTQWGGVRTTVSYLSTDYGASFTYHNSSSPLWKTYNNNGNYERIWGGNFSDDNKYVVAAHEEYEIFVHPTELLEPNPNSITYFGANTTLKANTGIEFPDNTTFHSTNKEVDGTTFKASTFESMTVIGDFYSPAAVVTSDYRIKTNVETLDETHIVDNLRPVKYKQTQTGKNDIGFLAHELQEHYPELVEGEKDGDKMQSVNYSGLLPILINEVQQLKKQIAETRARIHSETS